MKKNIIIATLLAASLLTVSVYGTNFISSNALISIDGTIQSGATNIVNKDGYTLVAFRDLFTMLGADVAWDSITKEIKAKKGEDTLVINTKTNYATINGEKIEMPIDVQIIEDTSYVSLRFACEAFGMKVNWDESIKVISIETGDDYLYLDDFLDTDKSEYIELEEALKIAKKNNTNLNNLKDLEKYQEEIRTGLSEQTYFYSDYDAVLENMLGSLRDVENSIEGNELTETIVADSIEFSIINMSAAIETTEINIKVLEEFIKVEEEALEILEEKYKYGLVSQADVSKANDSIKNNKVSLESLKRALDEQKLALKDILGNKSSESINVRLNKDFNEIDEILIDSYVTTSIVSDVSTKQLEQQLEALQLKRDKYSDFSSDDERLKLDNDIKAKQREIYDHKEELERKIRTAYNELISFKEKDKTGNSELQRAKEDYDKAVINYRAGNITENQLEQARLSVLSSEKNIEINKINYAIKLYTFSKPYLL